MSRRINLEKVKTLRQLGSGACANVYKCENKAIKIFKDILLDENTNYENLYELVGIENETCIFPEELLEDENGKIIGYMMECIEGKKLLENIEQLDLDKLQSAVETVYSDLKELSSKKVLFNDFNIGNVMWNPEKECMQIIDTDFYKKNEELSDNQVYSYNLNKFNGEIETLIGIRNGKFADFLNSNSEFSSFYREYFKRNLRGEKVSVNEILQKIKEVSEKEFGIPFSNLQDIKKAIEQREQSNNLISERNNQFDNEIPIFTPPEGKNSEEKTNLKEKIVHALSKIEFLRKVPVLKKYLKSNQLMLDTAKDVKIMEQGNGIKNHEQFVDEISGYGKYRNLGFRSKMETVSTLIKEEINKPLGPKFIEPKGMADNGKLEKINKETGGKSLEDDL